MDGNGESSGLQHAPGGGGLSTRPARVGLIARGRREAAEAAANPNYRRGAAHYSAGEYEAAAAALQLAAEAGHAEAQYLLSTMLDEGKGVPRDETQAAAWERRAAEQGHAYAQANLSFRFYAAEDYAEAFLWCERAAGSRLAWAQYHCGLMCRKGECVERNLPEAARWYGLAAAAGLPEAQGRLAELYTTGQGVPQSFERGAAWYRKAAELGDAEAQYQLGLLYAHGRGVEQDYVQSRHWIRQAALRGHEQAAREQKRREYRDA